MGKSKRKKRKSKRKEVTPDDGYRLARSDGKKLYLKKHAGDAEVGQDWNGPEGAHHATIEMSSSTHVYTVRWEWKTSVFDAAGALLGEVIEERWD